MVSKENQTSYYKAGQKASKVPSKVLAPILILPKAFPHKATVHLLK